ncbi:MAG: LysR family transcriptional regulator [Eubacterium sp.]|nr:LysR family transcriptional regulator [Eubacterium sp.]
MYDIRLKQIECFLNISETLSFTATARDLNISQPLASKWIKSLENELETELFLREKTGLSLTDEGRYLYTKWKEPYAALSSEISNMHNLNSHPAHALKIGVFDRYADDPYIRELIRSFAESNPDYAIETVTVEDSDVLPRLSSGELPVCFHGASFHEDDDDVGACPVRNVEFYIAVSRSNRLASRDTLTVEDLANQRFFAIAGGDSPASSRRIMEQCRKAGIAPRNMQEVATMSSLALSIIYQNGVTITSAEIANGYEGQIRLYPLAGTTREEALALFWNKSAPVEEAIRFAEYVHAMGQS